MVIAKLKQKIRQILESSEIESAAFEAEQLLKWGIGESYFIADPHSDIEEKTEEKITNAAIKRAKGEPLQYIIGEWDFYGYTFKVGEGVLIPRPETELLAEKALSYLNESSVVIDLCSGSGCIPIALAKKSGAECYGVEISREAIGYFEENNKLNNTEKHVHIIEGDVLDPSEETLAQLPPYANLITANPPYLTAEEMSSLQKEVRREPELALYGGKDGLDFYRVIFGKWKPMLKPHGIFAVEVGDGQGEKVTELMREVGFRCSSFEDYGGTVRCVLGVIDN